MKKLSFLIIGFFLISLISLGKTTSKTAFVKEKNSNSIYKETKSKIAVIERHRIWLNMTNNQGAFKQTLLAYVTGATNGVDDSYDGPSNTQNAYVDFYTMIGTGKFVIQGRALPFDINDAVPLGYKSAVDGSFSIAIEKCDGILATIDVFVEDKNTGVFHNLKNGPYIFATLAGTFNNRFALVYIDKTVVVPPVVIVPPVTIDPIVVVPIVIVPIVADPIVDVPAADNPIEVVPVVIEPVVINPIEEIPVTDPIVFDINKEVSTFDVGIPNVGKAKPVIVSIDNYQIKVNSFDEKIDKIMVYTLRGRQLYEVAAINNTEFVIQNVNSSHQFLIIKTQLKNGKWFVNRIVY